MGRSARSRANNSGGQVGTGTTESSTTPVQMQGIDDAIALASTQGTHCVLHDGGALWCTGYVVGYDSAGTAISSLVPVAWPW